MGLSWNLAHMLISIAFLAMVFSYHHAWLGWHGLSS